MGLGGDYRAVVEGETVKLEGKVPDQETLEKIVLTSGNVEGVAEVDVSGVEVEKAGEASVFHTVQKGDTLSAIARTYLGNAMKYPDIFEANKPMLKDPDLIYPGQVLRIPGGKAPAA
jgi:nucleoid-associated protein YgaU